MRQLEICALALLAVLPAAGEVKTPAIDYVVPLAEQPFSADPAVIWYDSFDDPAGLKNYFEFVTNNGLFAASQDEALGGSGWSLRGLFHEGTVSAGSLKVTFGDCPLRVQVRPGERFNQVYWRVYVKHQRGWTGNPAKLSRATSLAATDWSQAMIAHVWGGPGDFLTLDPARGIDTAGQLATKGYNDFAHLRWLGNKPTGEYPIFAGEESGKWVCVEAMAKLNTPGRADGAFSLWIDGRLDAWRDNLDWRGTWDERSINAVFLENYWNQGSPVEQARYFDDFVVSTQPIGLARTGLNPEVVKTPFESSAEDQVQSAFEVQIATECDPETVWESRTIAGDGNRVVVNDTNGKFRGRLAGESSLAPGTRYTVRVRQRDNSGAWSAWSAWRAVIQTASATKTAAT